jgi:hypothetical protein
MEGRDGDWPQSFSPYVRQGAGQRLEHHMDATGEEIGHGGRTPAIISTSACLINNSAARCCDALAPEEPKLRSPG